MVRPINSRSLEADFLKQIGIPENARPPHLEGTNDLENIESVVSSSLLSPPEKLFVFNSLGDQRFLQLSSKSDKALFRG